MQSITKVKLLSASLYGLAALISTCLVAPFFAFLTTPIAAAVGYFFGYNPETKRLAQAIFSGFLITLSSVAIFNFLFSLVLLFNRLSQTCPKVGFACLLNITEFFYQIFLMIVFTFLVGGLIIFPAGILAAIILHFVVKKIH